MITVTNLRKIFTEQGVKGASSWNRAKFNEEIEFAHEIAIALDAEITEERVAVQVRAEVAKPTKRGVCTECGRKEDFRASGLCTACREYAEWENEHSDRSHNTPEEASGANTADCPVCHPELDPRSARKTGRSRAGMVIIAKGTEIHKSETFRVAAEAAGWAVEMNSETYELPAGTTGQGTRYYATAIKAGNAIQLTWDGRAYDYPASSARISGKDRKIRNLKEALRVL